MNQGKIQILSPLVGQSVLYQWFRKVFKKLLLQDMLYELNVIPDHQFAFRQQQSTSQQCLRIAKNQLHSQNQTILLCSILRC